MEKKSYSFSFRKKSRFRSQECLRRNVSSSQGKRSGLWLNSAVGNSLWPTVDDLETLLKLSVFGLWCRKQKR